MKKLIEALHVIQDECNSHSDKYGNYLCDECALSSDSGKKCLVTDLFPYNWLINDEVKKALL